MSCIDVMYYYPQKSGGHGIRTRNPFRGTTFPVWPLAIRLPSNVTAAFRESHLISIYHPEDVFGKRGGKPPGIQLAFGSLSAAGRRWSGSKQAAKGVGGGNRSPKSLPWGLSGSQ